MLTGQSQTADSAPVLPLGELLSVHVFRVLKVRRDIMCKHNVFEPLPENWTTGAAAHKLDEEHS